MPCKRLNGKCQFVLGFSMLVFALSNSTAGAPSDSDLRERVRQLEQENAMLKEQVRNYQRLLEESQTSSLQVEHTGQLTDESKYIDTQESSDLVAWSQWNIRYRYGFNWKLGESRRDIIRFEHASDWKYGDTYSFIDVSNIIENDPEDSGTIVYGEWQPRFSLSKVFGGDYSAGLIKDVLTAHQLNFQTGSLAHLNGLGVDFDLPGFSFANANVYVRDDLYQSGSTWQVTLYGKLDPFIFAGNDWFVDGWVDFAGKEGDVSDFIQGSVKILLDVGKYFGHNEQVFFGVDLEYWHNTFGIEGEDQFVPQLTVQWNF